MRALILALGMAAAVSGEAGAGEWVLWDQVGNWRILQDGEYCSTHVMYKNGTKLGFGLSNEGNFSISFIRDQWKIPKGSYDVSLSVDRGPRNDFTAYANDTIISVSLKLNQTTSALLRHGSQLHVRMGSIDQTFNLTATSRMLPSLYRCGYHVADLTASRATGRTVSNPFEGRSNPFD